MSDLAAMADGAACVEEGIGPDQRPLVAVSFQRNIDRKQKYLEAEPKALGITQIGMSVFQITTVAVFLSNGLSDQWSDIPSFISSLLVTIAGSLAVAAGNLHLPTLKACLGMQIVACVASVFNLMCSLIKMDFSPYPCWQYYNKSNNTHFEDICHKLQSTHYHFFVEVIIVMQVAMLAISITLAVYCCKVANCCSPASKMPVITVHTAPVQQ